jgi:RsiW-degrading membrane proteinase PrsW (M82 family)
MALVGGVLGIGGAFVQELQAGGLLAVFIAAPIIEEGLKPAGIYILLTRWPQAVRSQLHVAWLTALSGVCFGVIESLVYVTFYFPDQGGDYVLFRFTIPVAMHAIASFVVGLGLSRAVIDWAAGRQRLPKRARNFYLAGVGLHAVYNTMAVVLGAMGVFAFE